MYKKLQSLWIIKQYKIECWLFTPVFLLIVWNYDNTQLTSIFHTYIYVIWYNCKTSNHKSKDGRNYQKDVYRQKIENIPLDKPLTNDLLISIITANTPRGINYNKINDKEVMRPMNDSEVRDIIFDGIMLKLIQWIYFVNF